MNIVKQQMAAVASATDSARYTPFTPKNSGNMMASGTPPPPTIMDKISEKRLVPDIFFVPIYYLCKDMVFHRRDL